MGRPLSDEQKKRYEESDRLFKGYKAWQKEWYATTLSLCPPEMMKILRYVRSMPDSAEDDFLQRVTNLDWLMNGHSDIRILLLRVIAKRMDERDGVLDDPLPPETNMYFEAKRILNVR